MARTHIVARAALFGAMKLERAASLLRGKGFGSYSIRQEVAVALRSLGHAPRLVIDVGGNRGEYAAAMQARASDCEIVIFEPARFNIDRLRHRFSDARNIHVEPYGLSDSQQDAVLFANEPGSGAASLSRRNLAHFGVEFDQEEAIKLITLDNYWTENLDSRAIDIIKLDIEGHELQALRGGRKAIASTSVVQFEFGGCNIDSRTFFQDFFYFFRDAGFDIFRISPVGLEYIAKYTEDTETFMTTNFLAVRSDD
jgi:FkbM family methyltransferase